MAVAAARSTRCDSNTLHPIQMSATAATADVTAGKYRNDEESDAVKELRKRLDEGELVDSIDVADRCGPSTRRGVPAL